MSIEYTNLRLLTDIALLAGGLVGGIALAFTSTDLWNSAKSTRTAFEEICRAKTVPISDLRSVLSCSTDGSDENLFMVTGVIAPTPTNLLSWMPNVLVSKGSGERGVALETTHAWITIDSKWEPYPSFFVYVEGIVKRLWKYEKCKSLTTVPFLLVGSDGRGDVLVNLDASTVLLPLTTVYQKPWPFEVPEFLEPYFGFIKPLGLVEEKILPLGKEVTVVGICSLQDGNPHIKACEKLPNFFTDMTKDEMVAHLNSKMFDMSFSAICLGLVSVGIVGSIVYIVATKGWHWREWRQQMINDVVEDTDEDEYTDGEEDEYTDDEYTDSE